EEQKGRPEQEIGRSGRTPPRPPDGGPCGQVSKERNHGDPRRERRHRRGARQPDEDELARRVFDGEGPIRRARRQEDLLEPREIIRERSPEALMDGQEENQDPDDDRSDRDRIGARSDVLWHRRIVRWVVGSTRQADRIWETSTRLGDGEASRTVAS